MECVSRAEFCSMDNLLQQRKSPPSTFKIFRRKLFNKTKNFLQELRDKQMEYKELNGKSKANIFNIMSEYI
ncbi:unnamed protein product [Callosobruchus maculatus]|uniref:Uncharacterized protein n=1 Tax=Callosobruchus maculatus TaxID=64391 RepID=A0A653CMB7_CALMS|nr:unnamed protein product [Callosobruchus maculatus]